MRTKEGGVMDIQKEREAFEAEFSRIKSDIASWVNTWDEEMQGYNHSVMCWFWHMWQAAKAQAVPEGFVLVPVETLNEALSWANCASNESWSDDHREEIDKHYRVIERAMIEAPLPEGFVLVPKEPSDEIIDKLASVICDEFDTTISGSAHCASEAYRTMVGESK